MKKVLIPVADGCEEIELITPVDILRRGGVPVDIVSVTGELLVKGRNSIIISADLLIENVEPGGYVMIVIPGGMDNVNTLKSNAQVLELLKFYARHKKYVAAICAGPLVLQQADLLREFEITSHPAVSDDLKGSVKKYLELPIVVDDFIITSRGAGTAEVFALELLVKLTDKETAEKVKREIVSL